jgi:ribosome-associated protein
MTENSSDIDLDLVYAIAKAADDKQAENVIAFDVSQQLAICGAFVLLSASNTRLVKALVDAIEDQAREAGHGSPLRVEGLNACEWVALDYGDVIVHVFLDETRRYYELERLWSDAPRIDLSHVLMPVA